MELKFIGGVFGGNIKPTPFLCLVLKMLQIQPEKDIVIEFIKNEDFKYVILRNSLSMSQNKGGGFQRKSKAEFLNNFSNSRFSVKLRATIQYRYYSLQLHV